MVSQFALLHHLVKVCLVSSSRTADSDSPLSSVLYSRLPIGAIIRWGPDSGSFSKESLRTSASPSSPATGLECARVAK